MGKKLHLILALTCALCFSTGLSAQDDSAQETDKPKATQQKKKGKKGQQAAKQKQRLAARVTKELSVELSEDQKKQLMELVGEKREKLNEIQKGINEFVNKENRKAIATAVKEARQAGKSQKEAMKSAWDKVGISEDDQAKIVELNAQRNEIFKGIKETIAATFSDDQKAAMKAKRGKRKKGGAKGKKAKKDADGELTSVSINLPGMT